MPKGISNTAITTMSTAVCRVSGEGAALSCLGSAAK